MLAIVRCQSCCDRTGSAMGEAKLYDPPHSAKLPGGGKEWIRDMIAPKIPGCNKVRDHTAH